MKRISSLVLSMALAASGSIAQAETEDGLYGAVLPDDALFVRRIGEIATPADVFGHVLTVSDLPEATYVALSAGALDGGTPGAHYSLLATESGTVLLREPVRADRSKVTLFLLNTASSQAQIVVADDGPTVIGATPQGQIASRAVNPLAVTLSVITDGASQDFKVVLRQGVNLTFVASDDGARMIENRFGPVVEAN